MSDSPTRPSSRRPVQLRYLLAALPALGVLPLAIFAAIMLVFFWQQSREQTRTELTHVARSLALAIDRELDGSRRELQRIAEFSVFDDDATVRQFALQAARYVGAQARWTDVAVSTPKGEQVVAAVATTGAPIVRTDRPHHRLVVATHTPVLSDVYSSATGQPAVAISAPVLRNGELKWILSARLNPQALSALLAQQVTVPSAVAAIIDRNDRIVARSHNVERFLGQPATADLRDAIARADRGTTRATTLDGTPLQTGWERMPDGWTVIVGFPVESYELPLRRSVLTLFAAGALMLIVGLLVSATIARRIAGDIQAAAADAARLPELRPLAGRPPAIAEIAGLHASLAATSRRLIEEAEGRRQAIASLAASEERVQLALTSTGAGTYDWNLLTNEIDWSAVTRRQFGVPANARIDRELFFQRIDPRDHPLVKDTLRAAMRGDNDGRLYLEMRVNDGVQVRWLANSGQMHYEVFDGVRRPVRLVGFATDISARKALEETTRAAHDHLRQVLDGIPAFVAVLRSDGRINEINSLAQRAFDGDPRGELFWECAWWRGDEANRQAVLQACEQAAAGMPVHLDLAYRVGDTRAWMHLAVTSLASGMGEQHLIATGIDISERKRAEDILHEREEQLRLAIDSTNLGTFDWNFKTGRVIWSDRVRAFFGFGDSAEPAEEEMLERVHSGDRPLLEGELRRAKQPSSGGVFFAEFRSVLPIGVVRWLQATGRVYFEQSESGGLQAARFAGVIEDVTDRKELEIALREADRRKDEFLAMLAHELRNPLAPLRNAVTILLDQGPASDLERRAIAIADRQIRHITRLVDDLLDVSRITRGKVNLKFEAVALRQVIDEAVAAVGSRIGARGQHLLVDVDEGLIVQGDSVRLVQVFDNLLGNASKFTGGGGRITVSAHRTGEMIEVAVTDDGVGIAADKIAHVFDLFTQIDATIDRSQGGLGIGLALVKQLTQLHGGDVRAESEGVDRGARFVVRLPAATAALSAAGPAAGPSGQIDALRVLVVDDNRDAATTMALLLEMSGHSVTTVYDGPAAIEAVRRELPEVVLLDIGLPGLSGIEVAHRLRAQYGESLVLIALTGYGQDADREATSRAGFDDHLVKPVELDQLLRAIASACQRREQRAGAAHEG